MEVRVGVFITLKSNDFGQLFLVVRTIPLFQLLGGLEEAKSFRLFLRQLCCQFVFVQVCVVLPSTRFSLRA